MTHFRHEHEHEHVCPLCLGSVLVAYHRDRLRHYVSCEDCGLVHVPADAFLSGEDEKAYYDLHRNDPADEGYRRFLSRLAVPMMRRLAPGASGLDFGSGPGPALSIMLREAGFPTRIYDPIYAPDSEAWQHSYDFITASEVVEHLRALRTDLERLWQVLKPGGWLGIMTKRVWGRQAFSTWHYKDDPTHVAFFAERTFVWLARHWSARLEVIGPDVVLLNKPAESRSTAGDRGPN
ncbi:class I SAM-dependent methyltransferase [Tautonia sp. JC769]|uniref:class I SAM-dependent methyltransferase n=1 Tax=Tautonia sp. JC769 TaxID=3232135 RepID=UPI00345A7A38